MRNRSARSRMKNAIKAVRLAVKEKSGDAAVKELNTAKSIIDKTARKGTIHRNTAARKISRLAKAVNSMGQASPS